MKIWAYENPEGLNNVVFTSKAGEAYFYFNVYKGSYSIFPVTLLIRLKSYEGISIFS